MDGLFVVGFIVGVLAGAGLAMLVLGSVEWK